MKAFIIHGAYGNPEENWYPWLKKELQKLKLEVIVPFFPTPDGQSLESWLEVMQKYDVKDSIMIGHSIGATFLLALLEKTPVKAAFLVSGFAGLLDNDSFDSINESISAREFKWEAIRNNCKHFVIFHSDNDPYVPIEKARNLGVHLNTEPIIIKGAGHFNDASGYVDFQELLDQVKKVL